MGSFSERTRTSHPSQGATIDPRDALPRQAVRPLADVPPETLRRGIELVTQRASTGASYSARSSDYLENANYFVILDEGSGPRALKIGWGDYRGAAPAGQTSTPDLYRDLGPIFVTREIDGHRMPRDARELLERSPAEFMASRAVFVIDGGIALRNARSPAHADGSLESSTATVDLGGAEGASILLPRSSSELLARIRTRAVREIIGAERFERFAAQVPLDSGEAGEFTLRLRSIHARWLREQPGSGGGETLPPPDGDAALARTYDRLQALLAHRNGQWSADARSMSALHDLIARYDRTTRAFAA